MLHTADAPFAPVLRLAKRYSSAVVGLGASSRIRKLLINVLLPDCFDPKKSSSESRGTSGTFSASDVCCCASSEKMSTTALGASPSSSAIEARTANVTALL
eukprot:1704655-Prymnesium_polylepis.1